MKPAVALWVLVAAASPASEIVFNVAFGSVPFWLVWLRLAVLVVILGLTVFVELARFLRAFCLAYGFQLALMSLYALGRSSSLYYSLEARYGFTGAQSFSAVMVLVSVSPVVVWAFRRPDRFYFRIGNLRAPLAPTPVRWTLVAPLFALAAIVCVLVFLYFTGAVVSNVWTMAAWAVLFAAINAFGEEFINRNVLVPAVERDFGTAHALLVSAFVFGIGHWNGLPAGVLGVLMTFTLGLAAGKAMVDTKGTFWSWFMHFVPDCALFYYWGIGSVVHATIGSGHL